MTQEQIQQAYSVALDYTMANPDYTEQELVQIGIQMAVNGEVFYNEDGSLQMIDKKGFYKYRGQYIYRYRLGIKERVCIHKRRHCSDRKPN